MKKLITIILLFLLNISSSYALIEVDITRGNLDPLPIAVSPLHVDVKSEDVDDIKVKNLGEDISKIIEKNFRFTGLFNPINKEAFVQKPDIAHLKPRFEDWRLIKAQALVTGKLLIKDGKLKVEFRLWDLTASKEISALAFTTTPSNWRRVAHIISDKIYERLTGEEGYFDTRIIYVSETGPKNQRVKRLAIMDQDGAQVKYLTLGNELVLTPRFNPANQLVTYLSYFRNLPRVYLLDIEK
jgi:TolB protein